MMEVKGEKRPIGLLVLTLISMAISLIDLAYSADIFIDGIGFYQLGVSIINITSYIILLLYVAKKSLRKKYIILIFLILKICLCIANFGRTIYIFQTNGIYLDLANVLVQVIVFVVSLLPFVFILLDLIKGNKKIVCGTFIILSCVFFFSLINAIKYIMNTDIYSGTEILLNGISGTVYTLLNFWLWFTQIAHNIIFKEKIKFDYKPIKKKVAVTETTLEELKLMYDNGTITESEYNRRKSEIINKL